MHDTEFREHVESAFDGLMDTNAYWVMRLAGENGGSVGNTWLYDHLVTPCPGCNSPGPHGECAYDCDWDKCPSPECDFEGHVEEHVEEQGMSAGYTGAGIYWATFKCGYQWMDASADNLEAAR